MAKALKDQELDQSPIEILRALQKKLVSGRKLEIENVADDGSVGQANLIMVDRNNALESVFNEIMALNNKFITLEVQFYNEVNDR